MSLSKEQLEQLMTSLIFKDQDVLYQLRQAQKDREDGISTNGTRLKLHIAPFHSDFTIFS